MTEPNGNVTSYAYDALNRQMTMTNAAGDLTMTTYDPNSNVKTVTAPNLNVTTYTYDALDRVTRVDDSVGPVATYSYDNVGNRLTQKDGNDDGTANTYDTIYRITDVTDALGKTTHYDYDPVGNLKQTTDREGHVTTYLYDDINRRIQMTDAQPFVTMYEYDGVGNLKKIKVFNDTEDPVDPPQVTSYDYDNINRLTKETYADGRMRAFTYDRVSNLKTRTDQKAQTTSYSYSDLYFLTRRDYPTSADDTMTYDLSGRMLTAERGGWPVTFAYDGANRVTTTVQNGKTLAYSYNIPGRTRSVTYPGGRSIVEATDARSRLGKIDDAGSPPPIVQYSYDLGNRVVSRLYRNGTATRYGYNANNWITSLNHVKSDLTQIAGFTHAYDNEGNKRFENKLHDPGASEAYQYDSVYRLIDFKVGNLVGSTVPVPATQTQYTLDGVGNWKLKTKDAIPETRTHNAVNEITSINGAPVLSDFNGNTSEDARYTYAYDEENRLTAVTRKSDSRLVGQYQYDALSRRVGKIADAATPSTPIETRYFYDSARIVEEQNPAGTTQATYVYGNYIDEVLTMSRAGQAHYYHQNSLWSVEAITNSAAAVVERYMYDAYGLPVVTDGSEPPGVLVAPNAWGTPHSAISNPWMFTGRQLDEETGLYFYRARYYDPIKGRFLQRDPFGDFYQYASSQPTFFLDPAGLATLKPATIPPPWRKGDLPRSPSGNGARGLTVPSKLEVKCECECCPKPSGEKFMFNCTVTLDITVYIDPSRLGDWTTNDVYGHEQQHAERINQEVQKSLGQAKRTGVGQNEGGCRYPARQKCQEDAMGAKQHYEDAAMAGIRNGSHHKDDKDNSDPKGPGSQEKGPSGTIAPPEDPNAPTKPGDNLAGYWGSLGYGGGISPPKISPPLKK